MAINRYAGDRFAGLSSDNKPENVLEGAIFDELDTATIYMFYGGSWVAVAGGAGGGINGTGIVNYYSRFSGPTTLTSGTIYNEGSYPYISGNPVTTGGPYYPFNNPSGFLVSNTVGGVRVLNGISGNIIITGSGDVKNNVSGQYIWIGGNFVTRNESGQFYPANNPSGFIPSGVIEKIFLTTGEGDIRYSVGTGVKIINGRSGIITISGSGDIRNGISGQVIWIGGNFVTRTETGQFYPSSNPFGYISSGYADNAYLTTGEGDLRYLFAGGGSGVQTLNGISGKIIITGSGDVKNNVSGQYIWVGGNFPTRSETGQFYPASNPNEYINPATSWGVRRIDNISGSVTLTGSGDIKTFVVPINNAIIVSGSFVTRAESGQFYPSSNPFGYISSGYADNAYLTTGEGDVRYLFAGGGSGVQTLNSLSGKIIITGSGDVKNGNSGQYIWVGGNFLTRDETGNFYPSSNPFGYISSGYADNAYLTTGEGDIRYLFANAGTGLQELNQRSGLVTISGSGDIGVGVSGQVIWVGASFAGTYVTRSETGQFYPETNPYGYIRSGDADFYYLTTGEADIRYLFADAGTGVQTLNSLSGKIIITGSGDIRQNVSGQYLWIGGDFPTRSETGQFYPASNPDAFLNFGEADFYFLQTGEADARYLYASAGSGVQTLNGISGKIIITGSGDVKNNVSGQYIWVGGNFVTRNESGQFYPANNPSGFIPSGVIEKIFLTTGEGDIRYGVGTGVRSVDGRSGVIIISGSGDIRVGLSGQTIWLGGNFVTRSESGQFYPASNTGNYLNFGAADFYFLQTGEADARYLYAGAGSGVQTLNGISGKIIITGSGDVRQNVSGQYIWVGGNFLTRNETGLFYPASNTGAYLNFGAADFYFLQTGEADARYLSAGAGSGVQILNGISGVIIITGSGDVRQNVSGQYLWVGGNFLTRSETGLFYPESNPYGYLSTGYGDTRYLTTGEADDRYVNRTSNQSITGNKVFANSIGLGESDYFTPEKDIHIRSVGSTVIYLEADTDNFDESHQAYIKMTTDGGLITGYVGYAHEGISPENTVYTGTLNNSFLIGTRNNLPETSVAGRLQFGTQGQVRMTFSTSGTIGILTNDPSQFELQMSGDIGPQLNNSFDLGAPDYKWKTFYGYQIGLGDTLQTPLDSIHVRSAGSASIYLEADTDNSVESDRAYVRMSQDGGLYTGYLGFVEVGVAPDETSYTDTLANAFLIGTKTNASFNNYLARLQLGTQNQVWMTITTSGNIGIRTTTPEQFELQIGGDIGPSTTDTYDLGSNSWAWQNIFGGRVFGSTVASGKELYSYSGISGKTARFFQYGGNANLGRTSTFFWAKTADSMSYDYAEKNIAIQEHHSGSNTVPYLMFHGVVAPSGFTSTEAAPAYNTIDNPRFDSTNDPAVGIKLYNDRLRFFASSTAGYYKSGEQYPLTIDINNGRVGIGNTIVNPGAWLHLAAGYDNPAGAPLKFSAGTLISSPSAGDVEFDGTHLYVTVGATRYQLDQQGSAAATPLSGIQFNSGDVFTASEKLRYDYSGSKGLWINSTALPIDNLGRSNGLLILRGVQAHDTLGANFVVGTDDNIFPHVNLFAYTHNNIHLTFDAYWSGGGWRSSASSSNYQFYKTTNYFSFHRDYGVTAGQPISWDKGWSMDRLGRMFIGNIDYDSTFQGQGILHISGERFGSTVAAAINLYAESQYPLRQTYIYNSDQIVDTYDCYYNGGLTYLSDDSSSKVGYLLYKRVGRFHIYASTGSSRGEQLTSDKSYPLLTCDASTSGRKVYVGGTRGFTNPIFTSGKFHIYSDQRNFPDFSMANSGGEGSGLARVMYYNESRRGRAATPGYSVIQEFPLVTGSNFVTSDITLYSTSPAGTLRSNAYTIKFVVKNNGPAGNAVTNSFGLIYEAEELTTSSVSGAVVNGFVQISGYYPSGEDMIWTCNSKVVVANYRVNW